MLKKYFLLVLTVIIICVYILIQQTPLVKQKTSHSPSITFDEKTIQVSVQSDKQELLKGVHASDQEDGDLTSQVFIESYSSFQNNHTRTVNYVVCDSDENITRASRQIQYVDYTPPVFSLNNQLRAEKYSVSELTRRVKATSCLDGDISHKVSVMDLTIVESGLLNVRLSVTDSTNTTSYLTLHYYIEGDQDIDIALNQYLIYLKKGESFDYKANIKSVTEKMTNRDSLIDYVNIEIPEMNDSGVYEVNYTLSRSNGNKGKTTLVVVVE